jgi:hypothetical protein
MLGRDDQARAAQEAGGMEMKVLYALGVVLCLAVVANMVWALLQGLRTGKLSTRAGTVLQRRKQPIAYWISFMAGCGFIAMMRAALGWPYFFELTH